MGHLRSRSWRPPAFDVVVALALLLVIFAESRNASRFPGPAALWVTTAVVSTVPLAWRRRAPLLPLVVGGSAIVVQAFAGGVPQSAGFLLVSLLFTYSVAVHGTPRQRWVGLATLLVVNPLYLSRDPGSDTIGTAIPSLLLAAAAWVVGLVVRARTDRAAAAERAAIAAAAQAASAIATERLRIAHELHDIVAHGLSVMVVQASAARVAWERGDAAGVDGLVAIEASGRSALSEMRRLLGVLRTDDETVHGPTPGLADLEALVAGVRRAGLEVTLASSLRGDDVGAALQLSLYRIVQEALTNVVKHAGATSARVTLHRDGPDAVVSVEDDGAGTGARQSAAHLERASPLAGDRGGAGLAGMRARAGLFGGSVVAGERAGGGFAVLARLPAPVEAEPQGPQAPRRVSAPASP